MVVDQRHAMQGPSIGLRMQQRNVRQCFPVPPWGKAAFVRKGFQNFARKWPQHWGRVFILNPNLCHKEAAKGDLETFAELWQQGQHVTNVAKYQ